MKNLASRYKALIALIPVIALILFATGIVPLAEEASFSVTAWTLVAMTFGYLMSDMMDSNLFIKALVKYFATLKFEGEAGKVLEAELDSLDDLIGSQAPANIGTTININPAPPAVSENTTSLDQGIVTAEIKRLRDTRE